MSKVLLHDSSRGGKDGWAATAITDGLAGGVVLSPWQTPLSTRPRMPSAAAYRDRILNAGGTVLFDPSTYGAHHPVSNNRADYDGWSLWPGANPTTTRAALDTHVDRCVTHADALGIDLLAPSLTLDSPQGANAQRSLDMLERTLTARPSSGATVAGTAGFWASGVPLDAFIGELISLRPQLVNVMMVRESLGYPTPGLAPDEIEGLCRSVHTLSLHAPVMVGFGDLAALPAVVAGATIVGSGYDLRHRMCALESFKISSGGGGGTPARVTHGQLSGVLKRVDAEALLAADAVLSGVLVPGPLPNGIVASWRHHLRCLTDVVDAVVAGNRQIRLGTLRNIYSAAATQFAHVDALVGGLETNATQWIAPLSDGLEQYAIAEGL